MSIKLKKFIDPASRRVYIAVGYVETREDPDSDWPHLVEKADGSREWHSAFEGALEALEEGLVIPEPLYTLE